MTVHERLEAVVATVFSDSELLQVEALSGGISAEMHLLHLRTPDSQVNKVVVRRFARHHKQGRDGEADHERRVLVALGTVATVPTAQVLHFDDTGPHFPEPFIVLSYIEGYINIVPAKPLPYLTQYARQLAAIHAVTPAVADLTGIRAPLPALGEIDIGPRHNALYDTGPIRDMLRTHTLSQRNRAVLLHGDLWPGNMLWQNGTISGVIDWEDAMLGDPLIDLAISQLDIAMLLGPDALAHFTAVYLDANRIDCTDLSYWQLCATLRLSRVIGQDLDAWVGPNADVERPTQTAQLQRARFNAYLEQAVRKLRYDRKS